MTGFGLFGHAHEMAERSGVRVALDAESMPALPGALEAAAEGVRTGGDARNRDFAAKALELNGVPDELVALGFDPQTAGGLLVSVAADKGGALGALPGRRALPRAHGQGRGREWGGGLLMEAGARTDRLRSLTVSPSAFAWFAYAALAALFSSWSPARRCG